MPHFVDLINLEQSVPTSLIRCPVTKSHLTSTLIIILHQTYHPPSTNISQDQRGTYFYPQYRWSVTLFLSSYLFPTAITPHATVPSLIRRLRLSGVLRDGQTNEDDRNKQTLFVDVFLVFIPKTHQTPSLG